MKHVCDEETGWKVAVAVGLTDADSVCQAMAARLRETLWRTSRYATLTWVIRCVAAFFYNVLNTIYF